MVDSIVGKPIVIGNSTATLNNDGSVKIKTQNEEKNVSLEEFKKYLIENAQKTQTGDTVSFKGEDSGETTGSLAQKNPIKTKDVGKSIFLGFLMGSGMHAYENKELVKILNTEIKEGTYKFSKYKEFFGKNLLTGIACAGGAVLGGIILNKILDKKQVK